MTDFNLRISTATELSDYTTGQKMVVSLEGDNIASEWSKVTGHVTVILERLTTEPVSDTDSGILVG